MKAITRQCAALIVGISLWTSASAAPASVDEEARIQACLAQAATAFQVDLLPLKLLRQVEAGTLGRVSGNTNGSYDIGPMQINSSWLPRLARIGITEDMVRNDACVNTHVAAWIYAQEYKATGNVVMAMARYHSPTARHQLRYLGLVRKALKKNLARIGQAQERLLANAAP